MNAFVLESRQKSRTALLDSQKAKTVFAYQTLVMVMALAAVLRFYKLGTWSIWIEEHHSLRHLSEYDSLTALLSSVRPVFFLLSKPIVYYLGVNEWTARLLPALVGIITIPLVYFYTKKIIDRPTALLAAVFLTISPWHIFWSQNIRFFTLLLVFFSVSLVAFYYGLEMNSRRYLILSVIALMVAVATHAIGALLVVVYVAYFVALKLLPFEEPAGLHFKNFAPLIVIPLIGYLSYEAYRLFIANDSALIQLIYTKFFNASTISFVGYANPYVMLTTVLYRVGTPLALLSLVGSYTLLRQRSRIGLALMMGAYIPLLVLMGLTVVASTSSRYVFMSLICWIVLGAVGLKSLLDQTNLSDRTMLSKVISGIALLGALILLLRDPLVEDVIYFISEGQFVGLIVGVLAAVILAVLFVGLRGAKVSVFRIGSMWGGILMLIAFTHPTVVDSLYFTYQNGHRDDWQSAMVTILENRQADDMVVAAMHPVASYYLNELVTDMRDVNLDRVLDSNRRVWFIENADMDQLMSDRFSGWALENCKLMHTSDAYAVGTHRKLRIHLCGLGMIGAK